MIDQEHMIDSIEAFPRWVLQGFDLGKGIKVEEPVSRVIVAGMGGSGIGGELLKSYLAKKIFIEVVHDEKLPVGVDRETLVFIVSYSGETKEILQVYREAHRKGCKVVVITSGGTLSRRAASDNKPIVKIPEGLPPRASLPFLFFPMLRVLQDSELIPDQRDAVLSTVKTLQNPQYKEKGEDLSDDLKNRVVLIYASPFLASAAYRWKCEINENAQAPAFSNTIPELVHNEVEGFLNSRVDFHIIMLREHDLSGFILKLFKSAKRVLKSTCKVTELVIKEHDPLSQLFSAVYIGDWSSYFLAIKYGTDPTPVPVIKEIKRLAYSLLGP